MADRSKSPGYSLLALALDECRAIRGALQHREDIGDAIHEARKAIRRLRSLFALAEDRVDGLASLDRSLERLGEGLSTLRDAYVAIDTARTLAATDATAPWLALVKALVRRHDTLLAQALAGDPGFARRRRTAKRVERVLQQLDWTPLRAKDLRKALKRSQRRVARAGRRVEEAPTPENMHRWRRRTRRLRMQLGTVRMARPGIAKAVAKPSVREELEALHALSEQLGWQQDLQVLRSLVSRMRNVPERSLLSEHLRVTIETTNSGPATRG
jgi:CHAD domain-containing protein